MWAEFFYIQQLFSKCMENILAYGGMEVISTLYMSRSTVIYFYISKAEWVHYTINFFMEHWTDMEKKNIFKMFFTRWIDKLIFLHCTQQCMYQYINSEQYILYVNFNDPHTALTTWLYKCCMQLFIHGWNKITKDWVCSSSSPLPAWH